ncbi:unnamed protein product [Wickerhamomyces anomalus]
MSAKRIALHPLVMLNLSDHYIRHQQQSTAVANGRLLGVLLGNEGKDGSLQLINSFEFAFQDDGVPDLSYLQTRLEQQSVILPNEYLVGVYEIKQKHELKPSVEILQLHDLLKEYNVDLVTLVFNPELSLKKFTNQKFVKIYDNQLNDLKYNVDTKEAEKVAVDTVLDVKDVENEDELNKATDQIESQSFILKTLHSKIELILEYLTKTDPASTPGYYDILRQVNSFISKVKFKQNDDIKTKLIDLETDYNMLISLGTMNDTIKGLDSINLDLKKYDSQPMTE